MASRDVGDVAPEDFVQHHEESVADLVQQVAHVATDPATQRGAREAVGLLVRGVVAVGLPVPEA